MIRTMLALSFRNAPGSRAPLILPVIAFAAVTTLIIAIIGGAQSFWTWTDEIADMYKLLAVIALSLLLIPLIALGGAAARLSARRRDDRLSTLRLLGATSGAVGAVTVIESAVLAGAGALVGVVLSFGVQPLIGLIPFRGEALGLQAVLLPWWGYLAVLLSIMLVAVISSVLGLRGVIISPLGVRTRQEAPKLSWVRALIAVVAVVIAFTALSAMGSIAPGMMVMGVILAVSFGGTLAVLNLAGPFVLAKLAKRQAARANTPMRLISARRITEDPKAAWRQVSGVAMTSFMAVFAGTGVAVLADVSASETDPISAFLIADIRTGVLITVIGSFVMVACAAAVTQAADILDRRDLARSLVMLGMPVETLDASRTRSVMSPLRIVSIGSAVIAAILLFPLVGIAMIASPLTLVTVAAVLAAGTLLVWGALRATTPLQRQVAAAA